MANIVRVVCVVLSLVGGTLYSQSTPAAAPSPVVQTPGASSGQNTTNQPATVLRYTTRMVVVDVIATDHSGKPVTDLKKEDFTIEEEGQAQQIDSFNFQAAGEGTGLVSATPNISSKTLTNAPPYDVSKTLTVILLDGLNTETKNQMYARQEMLKFLAKLPSGQPIAIYGLGTKLYLIQDFTADQEVLKKVVATMGTHTSPTIPNPTGGGGNNASYDPAMLEQMGELSGPAAAILGQVQQFEQDTATVQQDLRVQLTLSALIAIGRSLAGYPGRKNLIWLTQGFPLGKLANSLSNPADPNPRTLQNDRDYSILTARTASILTDAQVAVYPIDVAAVVNSTVYANLSNTDENGNYLGRTARGLSPGRQQAMTNEMSRTSVDQQETHASMNDLADRSGGKAFYGRNDVDKALSDSLADGSIYYSLGYHPLNKKWDGKFRKISVRVRAQGIKLRYRLGYFAVDPEAYSKVDDKRRNADLEQALNPDFPASTAVTFKARILFPSQETKNKLVVNYGIDAHTILFDPGANGQRAEVDCAVAAYTKGGKLVKTEVQNLKAELKPDVYEKVMNTYLPCQVQFNLPPAEYKLRLGVRDDRTGLIGTLNTSITVEASAAH